MSHPHWGRGVVASGHRETTRAAIEMLDAGGNAYDAAVAAGFAAAVAEPTLTSLGGGGFLLARTAAGEEVLFDFFVDTPGKGLDEATIEPHFVAVTIRFPGADQVFNTGLGSAAVPGVLAGLLHVHRRLGRLPLAEVVGPAIAIARAGIPLNRSQAYLFDLLGPILLLTEDSRRMFAPEGRLLGPDETFRNPDYALFLEGLAADPEQGSFYRGGLAERIAADMAGRDGLLTAEDLASYTVHEREPLAVSYRGHRLLTNRAPALGGPLIALALTLLDQRDPGESTFHSAGHISLLAETMKEVDRLRDDDTPAELLERTTRRLRFSRGTTQTSIVDEEGNVASMTTSNGEGSAYVIPGTGIVVNNMLGEDDLHPAGFHAAPPGERVASMMSPSILTAGEEVALVLGSAGSKRIRTALMQVISHVVDFGLDVSRAVDVPRLHWDGETLHLEPGLDESTVAELSRTWPVRVWDCRNLYFGGVHAVAPGPGFGADPRRCGAGALR